MSHTTALRLRHHQRQHRTTQSQAKQIALSQQQQKQTRYLVYVPYAGATNQLISIWHATMIAKHLNRTLLLPNLSPNVHVQEVTKTEEDDQQPQAVKMAKEVDRKIKRGLTVTPHERAQVRRPAGTRWSRFFDIKEYSRRVGVEIEELDDYLVHMEQESLNEEEVHERTPLWLKRHEKRWLSFWGNKKTVVDDEAHTQPKKGASPSKAKTVPIFADPLHCYSEGGYGMDRRMDVTGKQFLARYGISRQIRPTPFLNPKLDNGTIWARWRVDKVVERYSQPAFTQGEEEHILCLSHVYRLLPGGRNRAWVEFGQHMKYTKEVEDFVDEALMSLLKDWKVDHHLLPSDDKDEEKKDQPVNSKELASLPRAIPPFLGLHLRRGDFERHCHGIASPADPNGWNRCYPSTQHVISMLSDQERSQPAAHPWPVLVLSNERDPRELAKAEAQGWIRVDHGQLGTVERFGGYGPIMVDGALLAKASLLVGVEYSTYFRTASLRAETWHGGRTLFVT
ncbi:hypothetical protein BGZ73_006938 [Actinomortierella ambigua]|nr:hypothetical protein BGZ73_006938 [Actinomortierella ambigua]